MYHLRRLFIVALCIVASWFALSALHRHLDPNDHKSAEEEEDRLWIATSKYWLDRAACRWIDLCGLAHYHPDPAVKPWRKRRNHKRSQSVLTPGGGGTIDDDDQVWEDTTRADNIGGQLPWDGDETLLRDIPQFVLDHAPLVHLYSEEHFLPSHMAEHLEHLKPYINHTSLHLNSSWRTLQTLQELNAEGKNGKYLYLRSKDDVEERPEWLGSTYNTPIPYEPEEEEAADWWSETHTEDTSGFEDIDAWFDSRAAPPKTAEPFAPSFRIQSNPSTRPSLHGRREAKRAEVPLVDPRAPGRSPAPAILILVDKGHGILDAFWFYFYSYNLGTTVFSMRFGNHVGDWEHSLIRFHNGVPKAVFFSAHSGGTSYAYKAVEKSLRNGTAGRPVLYSARGSHAMYAMPGRHPYVLPFGILADVTDRGPLWDPALNYYAYHYNTSVTHDQDSQSMPFGIKSDSFLPAKQNKDAPTGWFWFNGHWGDKFYELLDLRQWRFWGQYHYVNGPFGPRFKNLGRNKVCQSSGKCRMLENLEDGKRQSWIER